jgi:hypothetical protein
MHKAAVDNDVFDLIRPLVNKGIRPESISKLLLELHSKKCHRDFLADEYEISKAKQINPAYQSEFFFVVFR